MTDRWRHDRTGDRVPADDRSDERAPVATKGPRAEFEITATWIEGAKILSATRRAPDQHELAQVRDELCATYGDREAFSFDIDIVDARGYRRPYTQHGQLSKAEQLEHVRAARAALRHESEVF